jgi:hypothetical protein
MSDKELLDLINSYSDEKIQEIESVDKDSFADKVIIVGLSNQIKRIEFTLTTEGDFSYKFLGIKFRNLLK